MHKQPLIKKLLRYTRNLLIFFFASTILAVIVYRFMPVYVTPLMVIRSVQQLASGDKPTWKRTWVSFDKISPQLRSSPPKTTVLPNIMDLILSRSRKRSKKTRNGNGSAEQVPSVSRQPRMCSYGRNHLGCAKDSRFISPFL